MSLDSDENKKIRSVLKGYGHCFLLSDVDRLQCGKCDKAHQSALGFWV